MHSPGEKLIQLSSKPSHMALDRRVEVWSILMSQLSWKWQLLLCVSSGWSFYGAPWFHTQCSAHGVAAPSASCTSTRLGADKLELLSKPHADLLYKMRTPIPPHCVFLCRCHFIFGEHEGQDKSWDSVLLSWQDKSCDSKTQRFRWWHGYMLAFLLRVSGRTNLVLYTTLKYEWWMSPQVPDSFSTQHIQEQINTL